VAAATCTPASSRSWPDSKILVPKYLNSVTNSIKTQQEGVFIVSKSAETAAIERFFGSVDAREGGVSSQNPLPQSTEEHPPQQSRITSTRKKRRHADTDKVMRKGPAESLDNLQLSIKLPTIPYSLIAEPHWLAKNPAHTALYRAVTLVSDRSGTLADWAAELMVQRKAMIVALVEGIGVVAYRPSAESRRGNGDEPVATAGCSRHH